MQKMYKDLINECKNAISSGRCLGCTALENPNFIGNPNCEFCKLPNAKQSINQIFKNLGVERK